MYVWGVGDSYSVHRLVLLDYFLSQFYLTNNHNNHFRIGVIFKYVGKTF